MRPKEACNCHRQYMWLIVESIWHSNTDSVLEQECRTLNCPLLNCFFFPKVTSSVQLVNLSFQSCPVHHEQIAKGALGKAEFEHVQCPIPCHHGSSLHRIQNKHKKTDTETDQNCREATQGNGSWAQPSLEGGCIALVNGRQALLEAREDQLNSKLIFDLRIAHPLLLFLPASQHQSQQMKTPACMREGANSAERGPSRHQL